MFKKRFFSIHTWVLLIVGMIFLKIYQHNLYIKTMYDYQRLEQHCGELEKKRNELLVASYHQKQPVNVMHDCYAQGMVNMSLDTLISTTQVSSIDFINTSSNDQHVLAMLGVIVPLAGGVHGSS